VIDVRHWVWKLNFADKTCFNEENKVLVKIENDGQETRGRILDMSCELYSKIARLMNGPTVVQQIVVAAENEFLRNQNDWYWFA